MQQPFGLVHHETKTGRYQVIGYSSNLNLKTQQVFIKQKRGKTYATAIMQF